MLKPQLDFKDPLDPMDTCPYDPVHRVRRSRMPCHLTKCAKNFPDSNKKQCPFDARHLISEVEYQYHVSTCPSQDSVLHYQNYDPDAINNINLLPIENTPASPSTDENWEDDIEVKSYNPHHNIADRPVLRVLVGAPKSQRKQFRLEERMRHMQLEEINQKRNKERSRDSASAYAFNGHDDQQEEEKPLRPLKKHTKNLSKSFDVAAASDTSHNSTLDSSAQFEDARSQASAKSGASNRENSQRPEPVKAKEIETKTTKILNMIKEEDITFIPANVTASSETNYYNNYNNNHHHNHTSSSSCSPTSFKSPLRAPRETSTYNMRVAALLSRETPRNRSAAHSSFDESMNKLSRTVEELSVNDEEALRKRETLDRELESLKRGKYPPADGGL